MELVLATDNHGHLFRRQASKARTGHRYSPAMVGKLHEEQAPDYLHANAQHSPERDYGDYDWH